MYVQALVLWMCMHKHECPYGSKTSTLSVVPQEPFTLLFETGALTGLEFTSRLG